MSLPLKSFVELHVTKSRKRSDTTSLLPSSYDRDTDVMPELPVLEASQSLYTRGRLQQSSVFAERCLKRRDISPRSELFMQLYKEEINDALKAKRGLCHDERSWKTNYLKAYARAHATCAPWLNWGVDEDTLTGLSDMREHRRLSHATMNPDLDKIYNRARTGVKDIDNWHTANDDHGIGHYFKLIKPAAHLPLYKDWASFVAVVQQCRDIFSEPAQAALADYNKLYDLAKLASLMVEIEDALSEDRDTEVVNYVKNTCAVHQLGPKKVGPDPATQYVTHTFFGNTPKNTEWARERTKVMQKKHTGDVLRELSETFGHAIFFVLPPSAPTFCLKAHSQREFVGLVARRLAAAEDVKSFLSAMVQNVVEPLSRGTAPQIALVDADTTNMEDMALDMLFTPSKPTTSAM